MKKAHILFVALLFALAGLAGCGGGGKTGTAAAPGDEKLRVAATIFPPYDFVREIAGEGVELIMLLPPGAESHSFEPTPQDIITIQNCDVFIHVGGGSDAWIEGILGSMDTEGIAILSLMEMVEAKPEERVEGMEAGHAHNDAQEPELDEHVWTLPQNAMRIVQVLSDTLCSLDAAHADTYKENATAYLGELEALDGAFEEVVANAARKTLVFGDRFPFRYLADAYGLDYYAAFPGCAAQAEPSAATVAFLIDKVETEDIPVVFHIELSNEKMTDTICADTGAQKRLLHSCHNVTRAEMEGGAGYLSLMTQNVEALKEALQ